MLIAVVAGILVLAAAALAWYQRDSSEFTPKIGWYDSPEESEERQGDRHIDGVIGHYELEQRDTGFFGAWRETEIDGLRVAFQGDGDELRIYVGRFDPDEEQLTDLYLGRVCPEQPLPEASTRRLDRFVGENGRAIAQMYFLNASGSEHPELGVEEIRKALRGLSDSVREVGFFESGGVWIHGKLSTVTPTIVDSDVRHAVAAVRGLESARVPA